MPNALQICSNDSIEGIRFFLYQDEIVDCVNSARLASSYSVHPFSSRYEWTEIRSSTREG